MNDIPTPEEIAQHYAEMINSANIINSLRDAADWYYHTLAHNVQYLQEMLLNDWWDGYDLAPIIEALESVS